MRERYLLESQPMRALFSDCSNKTDGYYLDPYSCIKYWKCQDGVGLHKKCPPSQYWHPVKLWCDWSVECGSRPPCNECEDGCPSSSSTTPEPDCLPPDQVVNCSQLGHGIFADENNCRSFTLFHIYIYTYNNLVPYLLALFVCKEQGA